MSKILKNVTGSNISIVDTGITVLANNQYTIPPQDYLLWAASNNIITRIGAGSIVVNDGSVDLSISDGTDLIKGLYPKKFGVLSGDDLTSIGHVGDRLKVDTGEIEIKNDSGNPIPINGNVTATLKFSDIQRNAEFSINSKVETDVPGVTYTVTTGKIFYITQFAAASDSPSPVSMRIRVYNGATLVNTIKVNLASNGAWGGHSWPQGVAFAQSGYTVKATFDPQAAKGSGWAMFAGFEV
jgi:hypothetical protein